MLHLPRPYPLASLAPLAPLVLVLGGLLGALAWTVFADDPDLDVQPDLAAEPDPRCQVHLTDDLDQSICTLTYVVLLDDGVKVTLAQRVPVVIPRRQGRNTAVRWKVTQDLLSAAQGDRLRIRWTIEKAERLKREYVGLGFVTVQIDGPEPAKADPNPKAVTAKR